MIFEEVKRYALDRLANELDPRFTYHCLEHTRDDVLPAAENIASRLGVEGDDLLLLRTAALFHDIGFIENRNEHEVISVKIARQVLPDFGYSHTQLDLIDGMIMATRIPQSPHSLLEQIMADADLDILGRVDFLERNNTLRSELAAFEQPMSDEQWWTGQLKFIRNHQYFTIMRTIREEQKRKNILLMENLLSAAQNK